MMDNENNPRTESILKAIPVILLLLEAILNLTDIWHLPGNGPSVLAFIRLLVLWMIMRDGSILQSRVNSVILAICAVLLSISAMFKIMHWPFGNSMLILGFVTTGIFYSTRFFTKPHKGAFDLIKWVWVISCCILSPLILLHWMAADLRALPEVFWILLMLAYLKELMRKGGFRLS